MTDWLLIKIYRIHRQRLLKCLDTPFDTRASLKLDALYALLSIMEGN